MASTTPPANALCVIVRFTTAISDLTLDVIAPSKTTVVALKQQIRDNLAPPTSSCRLRLIYSGKILSDSAIITTVLKIPPPPPRQISNTKGKGKAVEPAAPRIYINCSIGDPLSEEELSAEAIAAAAGIKTASKDDTVSRSTDAGANGQTGPQTTTTAAPRGFDRLLTAGFTPAEVGQLRLHFLSIQARINTPDSMPSPTSLRRMEDAWIDDNGGAGGGDGGGGALGQGTDVGGGALDDLLWGHITAFFWPLGVLWLTREDVWSDRRKYAVFTGFLLSLTFGILHVLA